MAKIILYYSLSGKTKVYAEKLASANNADLVEIREEKKRNGFTAFFPGVFQARGLKCSPIQPLDVNLAGYEEITILGPIWAGRLAPAVNSAIALLPAGKIVSLIATSGGGGYNLSCTAALVTARNCTVKEERCLSEKDL